MDAEDQKAITQAVKLAEAGTAGEIVVVVDRAASSYRSVSLVVALVLSLLTPWPLLLLTATSAPRIFLVQLIMAAFLLGSFLWYGKGGRMVPGFIKRRRAHEAALREFMKRGLSRTSGRTGVLLYVALQERYAEVIADSAFDQRVEPKVWQGVVDPLLDAAREGRLRDGLVAAVERLGVILAQHAPRQEGDIDELPDRVVVL